MKSTVAVRDLSFEVADDLTAINLDLDQVQRLLTDASQRASRVLEAGELSEGESLDLKTAAQVAAALARLVEATSRPLAGLFTEALLADDLAGLYIAAADDLPY